MTLKEIDILKTGTLVGYERPDGIHVKGKVLFIEFDGYESEYLIKWTDASEPMRNSADVLSEPTFYLV